MPLVKPFNPSLSLINFIAPIKPLQFRIAGSVEVPRVCRRVLATSRGVVAAAANAPARPPDMQ
jgi:hypothetical protein